MTPTPRLAAGLLALVVAATGVARALPQRTLVARPLPPAVLAAAEAGAPRSQLTPESARSLTDSLLAIVGAVRQLKPLRPVPVRPASRGDIRARLEEITRQDAIETNLRQEEKLLRFLGLVPNDVDLVKLYYDLLEEQLAGFYDIDRRELVLADWLSTEQQVPVLSHELAHALQDQHFSLRVRKRLGFENPDAEAAWNALIEGDATAVMAETALAPLGEHFPALADSGASVALAPPAARAAAGGLDSERLRAAPPVVREELAFPYAHGLRYVAALYRQGGWKAVDAAYIRPPASTEQVLHPDRFDIGKDLPVRITIPDLRALLGESYQPAVAGILGEHDLASYLAHYDDPEVARVSAEGWSGCSYALYTGGAADPPAFVLASTWDSEDDAVEFFGGLIGVLEARYPGQRGDAELSSQDEVIWNLDPDAKHVNVLRLREREVLCLEAMPSPRLGRILAKLDGYLRVDDPSPEARARLKENLPWNRHAAPLAAGALTPRLDLPPGWVHLDPPGDSLAVLRANRGTTQLELFVDRAASREIGLDGYAHAVAARLQQRGKNVYVQTDIDFPRTGDKLYQHIFTQTEGDREVTYCLGVADLGQGTGYLQVWGTPQDDAASLEKTFYELLRNLELVPETASPSAPSDDGRAGPKSHD